MQIINIISRFILPGMLGGAAVGLLVFTGIVLGARSLVRETPPVPLPEISRDSSGGLPEASLPTWMQEDGVPDVLEVQKEAVRYAEVMPNKIQRWRQRATWCAWLPKVNLSLDRNKNQTIASATSGGRTSFAIGPEDQSVKMGIGLTWNLADLVWNRDQVSIDSRSRALVQLRQQILEEVTQLYFERKRLLIEFQANPTDDPILEQERRFRIEEISARLDAFTDGFFSAARSGKK